MKLRVMALVLVLVLTLGLLAGCGEKKPAEGGGDKIHATVILVLEDESEVKYELNVSAGKTIREALYEAELISEDSLYAMFLEDIDGHVADVLNDGCTWIPCDMDGNQIPVTGEVMSAFDSYKLKDGDSIKVVYTVVPNFDD